MFETERDHAEWVLNKLDILKPDRISQLNALLKFARSTRAEAIREASKLLLEHKHESTTEELIDRLDELAEKAEGV